MILVATETDAILMMLGKRRKRSGKLLLVLGTVIFMWSCISVAHSKM